jgi:DNA-binding PadR family transcriptional regulator
VSAVLRPAALTRPGSAELVAQQLRRPGPEGFADACHVATSGNPFLLRELLRALAPDGAADEQLTAVRVERIAPETISRATLARLRRIGPDAGALARAVAVLGKGAELRDAAALAGLDTIAAIASREELPPRCRRRRLDIGKLSSYSFAQDMRRKPNTLLALEASILETGLEIGEFHGYALARHLQEREAARRLTAHGTLYKALGRMETAGLLASRWESDAAAAAGRPRRRLYEVTGAGARALAAWQATAATAVSARPARGGLAAGGAA